MYKITSKNKNKDKYSERTSKSFLGRTYDYHYVNSNNPKPSLPCPALRCTCGLFSTNFDHYDDEIKKMILINTNNNNLPNDEVSWMWGDWNLMKH